MVGLWGLVEHSCESPPLDFSVVEQGDGDDVGFGKCCGVGDVGGVRLEFGSCTVVVCKRGFYVWNYGQDFVAGMRCQCLCLSCVK
jgi:hypothetical protein